MSTEYIDTLDIPTSTEVATARKMPIQPSAMAASIQKPKAFVDGGSLVAFVAGVSGQNREDVLNSTLLAQLAADKAHSREDDVMSWYSFYSNVLGKVGWVTQGYNWEKYTSKKMSFTMDEAVLELAATALTGQEELAVGAALDAMRKLPKEDGRIKLFDHSSSSDQAGNFQISVCSEDNGAVAMKTMAFYYDAEQQDTTVLFFNFNSASTTLTQATNAQTLNSQVYANVRDNVVTKLGDKAKSFVLDLDI